MSSPGTLSHFTIYRRKTFGPIVITAKTAGVVVDLSGWSAASKAHRETDGVEINLTPTIPTGTDGKIYLADFTASGATDNLLEGLYQWDLALTTSAGALLPPSIEGTFTIKDGDS